MVVDVSQAPAPGKPEKEKPEQRIGAVLAGRYRITRVLGTGGMGSVYEAIHTTTEKKVAIKLLAGHLSRDLKLVARFRREAMAASRLEHENCVSVDDFGEDGDGTFYIAMELVNGRGLADELRASGPMPAGRVARIGVQLLKALDAAHVGGVLHRDLKPQNVMVTQKAGRPDIVKVVDFGIAKITTNDSADQQALTIPGTIFGTPEYMSPEQARGETLDARSDLYSAAVVLWHMMLGRSPFRGSTVRDTLLKVFSETAPSPMLERPGTLLPPGFEAVLQKAMAKNRDERWADAASFAAALSRFADGGVVDLPTRARPGLPVDGSAPAPTLEKMPAVSSSVHQPSGAARAMSPRDTIPLSAADIAGAAASISPATEMSTRFGSAPSLPPPTAAVPFPSSAPLPAAPFAPPAPAHQPPAALQGLSAPMSTRPPPSSPRPGPSGPGAERPPLSPPAPPASQPAPSPVAPPPQSTAPVIPAGAPKAARVLNVDQVKRQSQSSQNVDVAPIALTAPPQRISIAALVVVVGGLLLLGGFTFVAVLVVQGKLLAPPEQGTMPMITTPTTTPDSVRGAPMNPGALQQALLGEVPLDPLARDAAIGRAERAIAEGRRGDARTAFEEAVAADPTAPPALIGLGTLAMQQKDWTTARDCFDKLMAIDKNYRRQFGPMYARAKKLAETPPP